MNPRDDEILAMFDNGRSTRDVADQVGVSQSTVSRVVRRHRANEQRTLAPYVRRDYHVVAPMPDPQKFARHTLYRFYDANEVLLYVGVTGLLPVRLGQHAESKVWFEDVATVRIEHFVDRAAVEEAERQAISNEAPRYNSTYNSTPWLPEGFA